MQERAGISSVSVIGAGNVGSHIIKALRGAGFRVMHIISRSGFDDPVLAAMPDTRLLGSLKELQQEPDLYLLCVQDEQIPGLAKELQGSKSLIAHTSGSTDISVFEAKASDYGVFYPLQTFTRKVNMEYSDIPFLLEADSETSLAALSAVAQKISGKWQVVNSRKRLIVHLAAVFACNFGNQMSAIAESIMEKEGMELELLLPILRQTFLKIEKMPPSDAQTGPALRNDRSTMDRHLEYLESDPELKEIYKLISERIRKSGK